MSKVYTQKRGSKILAICLICFLLPIFCLGGELRDYSLPSENIMDTKQLNTIFKENSSSNNKSFLNGETKKLSSNLLRDSDKTKLEIIKTKEKTRFYSVIALCVVSLVSLLVTIFALNKINGNAKDLVMATGLNFIIFGTIILVTIADTEQQLTAAIGILGAIAGYLFGSRTTQ